MARWYWHAGCPQPCKPKSLSCPIVYDFQESEWDVLSGSGYSWVPGTYGGELHIASGGSIRAVCNVPIDPSIGRNVAFMFNFEPAILVADGYFKVWTNADYNLTDGYYMERGAGSVDLIAGDSANQYTSTTQSSSIYGRQQLGANDGYIGDVRVPNVNAVTAEDPITGQSWYNRPAITWINPAAPVDMYVGIEVQAIASDIALGVVPGEPYIIYQTRNVVGRTCDFLIGTAACYDPAFGGNVGACKEYTLPSAFNLTIPPPIGGSACCAAYAGDYLLAPGGSAFPCPYYWEGVVPGGCGGGDFRIRLAWQNERWIFVLFDDPVGFSWNGAVEGEVVPSGQNLISCLDLDEELFWGGSFPSGDCQFAWDATTPFRLVSIP